MLYSVASGHSHNDHTFRHLIFCFDDFIMNICAMSFTLFFILVELISISRSAFLSQFTWKRHKIPCCLYPLHFIFMNSVFFLLSHKYSCNCFLICDVFSRLLARFVFSNRIRRIEFSPVRHPNCLCLPYFYFSDGCFMNNLPIFLVFASIRIKTSWTYFELLKFCAANENRKWRREWNDIIQYTACLNWTWNAFVYDNANINLQNLPYRSARTHLLHVIYAKLVHSFVLVSKNFSAKREFFSLTLILQCPCKTCESLKGITKSHNNKCFTWKTHTSHNVETMKLNIALFSQRDL